MDKKTVLILFGGMSPEHEVSCASAASVIANIDRDKYDIIEIGITKDGRWILTSAAPDKIEKGEWLNEKKNTECFFSPSRGRYAGIHTENGVIKPDCVFPVLHGENGEDGRIQGLFTLAGIPFVGCGTTSAAVCMDKALTKRLCALEGISQAECVFATASELESNVDEVVLRVQSKLSYPVFVKPANTGSSVGVSKAKNAEDLKKALVLAGKYDEKILVEEFIDGLELETAVMGNRNPIVSGVGQILPSREFYSYEAKYIDGTSGLVFDPDIPAEAKEKLRATALKVYKLLDCRGLSRVDFFLRKSDGEVIFNEINTIPGFTSISMFPKLFERAGVPYRELISRLIDYAFEEGVR